MTDAPLRSDALEAAITVIEADAEGDRISMAAKLVLAELRSIRGPAPDNASALSAQGEQPPDAPLASEIEEFRREHHIPDDGKLEPWAIQENRVLDYLCSRAGGEQPSSEGPDFNIERNLHADTVAERYDAAQPSNEAVADDIYYEIEELRKKAEPQGARAVLPHRSGDSGFPEQEPSSEQIVRDLFEQECKDGDRLCKALNVERTEGGRLNVGKMLSKIKALRSELADIKACAKLALNEEDVPKAFVDALQSETGFTQSSVPEGWKPTVSELEWLLVAPDGLFKVELQPNGEVRATLTERGIALLAAAPVTPQEGAKVAGNHSSHRRGRTTFQGRRVKTDGGD